MWRFCLSVDCLLLEDIIYFIFVGAKSHFAQRFLFCLVSTGARTADIWSSATSRSEDCRYYLKLNVSQRVRDVLQCCRDVWPTKLLLQKWYNTFVWGHTITILLILHRNENCDVIIIIILNYITIEISVHDRNMQHSTGLFTWQLLPCGLFPLKDLFQLHIFSFQQRNMII